MKAKIEKKPEGDHFLNLSPDNKEDELLISLFESWRIIGRLEEELASKNQECDDWMNQNKYLVEQVTNTGVTKLENEIIQLKASLAHMEDQRNHYLNDRNLLMSDNSRLCSQNQTLLSDGAKLADENAELNDRLRTHKDVIAHLEEQRNNLKNDNAAGTEALDQLNKEVIRLRSENANLKEENANHKRFREIDVEKYNDLHKENAELKRQLAAMTKTVFGNDNTKEGFYVDCPFHKANCYKDTCIVHGTCVAQNENNLP
jgi:chromosome segregation ATPase